jgi:hypothetical protein
MLTHSQPFRYIPEHTDFLSLFPHRHSYLWAPHPKPGDRPDWQTETKHPLSDRLIQQGAFLYGVRFGKLTHYLMLDIDASSQYHPSRDPYAITRIVAALEPLSLTHHVSLTSSYSGGLHLYFPFYQGQASWAIANAAAALLEANGIVSTPGQLELFPNPRRYSTSLSDYNGHRLPLQAGSYLLDDDYQPIFTTRDRFVERWNFAEAQNHVSREAIDLVLKQFERRRWMFIQQKALKFLNDLNAEIEPGWTGFGQTNRLLGRIALREYVFFHVLHNTEPLTGLALQMRILEVAIALPGFKQWSKHQDDLPQLICYWARSVEASPKYYPYGGNAIAAKQEETTSLSVNQQRSLAARQRIEKAVQELEEVGQFPAGIKARHFALKAKGIGTNTLYKNKDLWYGGNDLKPAPDGRISAIAEETEEPRSLEPAPDGRISAIAPISFICDPDCLPKEADPDEHTEKPGGSGGNSTAPPGPRGVEHVKAALASIRRRQKNSRAPAPSTPPDQSWFQSNLFELAPHAGRTRQRPDPHPAVSVRGVEP